jgi:hypothetical protein
MASEIKVNTIKDLGGNTVLTSNGSGTISGLPASAISSGTVATARLGSGTASSSTFLAGDSSYKTVSGTTINNNANNRLISGSGTANTLEGEANLTFDGSTFTATGTSSLDGAVVINESGANKDFRVESDAETHMLTVSGANNVVGISESGFFGDLGVGLHIKTNDSGSSVDGEANELVLENGSDTGMSILSGTSGSGSIFFGDSGANGQGRIVYYHGADAMRFVTASTERGSFRASNANSGSLVVGGTSWDTWYHFQMRFNGNSGGAMVLDNSQTDTNGTAYIQFKQGNSAIGYISRNGTTSGVTYSTSSDYRLKENVNYTWDATTKLKELKPAKFTWKADPSNQIVDGFLAHEVSSIVPEAITGTKDETETKEKVVISNDGTITAEWIEEADWIKGKADNTYENDTTWEATKVVPKYQAIDQSKLVPLLVKTIQELEARITTLESA